MLLQAPAPSPEELPGSGMLLTGCEDSAGQPPTGRAYSDGRDHYQRCVAYLATLRLAASRDDLEPIPAALADDVSKLTDAIVAEATAEVGLTVAAQAGARQTATAGFLAARLVRLRLAAEDAVTAARTSDASALRQHVSRLEALTLALWTVQAAVSTVPDLLSATLPPHPLKAPTLRPTGQG
jgi:hypothetical protein